MIIKTENNLTAIAPRTYLSQAVAAGNSIFPWKSPIGNAQWAVQLGNTGEAQSEILLLTSSTPAGTAGTTSANSLYDHAADTPIFAIKYDQIVFERSTTGTAGTAAPISNGTVGIMSTGTTTFFDDTTGASTYAYKTMFRNSSLAVNSTESDWITPTGFSFYSLGKIRQRVKDKLVSAGYISGINVDDSMIADWINEWMEIMTNEAIAVNEAYSMGTMEIDYAGTTELGTITATDFKQLYRVWYTDGSGTYTATKMDANSFSPNKTFVSTFPYFYMQGDNIIGRKPSDSAGTFTCEYYKLSPVLVEDTDQIPVNMQAYTKSFVDYGHSQALFKDQKIQEAKLKSDEAYGILQKFIQQITPRNKTGSTFIEIVEDVASEQELFL